MEDEGSGSGENPERLGVGKHYKAPGVGHLPHLPVLGEKIGGGGPGKGRSNETKLTLQKQMGGETQIPRLA